jgi:hypothetical protein
VITIEQLLRPSPELRSFAAQPEVDPLTENDALQEAQLLELRFDALHCTVGLLFELRLALQLRSANTGVLVAHGVHDLSWSAALRSTSRTAWNVVGSEPRAADSVFGLELSFSPEARLSLSASHAAFFTGEVPGLSDTPPNYGGADEPAIRAQLAGWNSNFIPVHAVFLDPAPA